MTRHAKQEDFPQVLALARRFFAATGYAELVAFDDESFKATFMHLLGDDGACIVAEDAGQIVGIAGALAYPFYFNSNHKTGQELFWWMNEEQRGSSLGAEMFAALETWARSVGCKTFSMIALEKLRPDSVAKIYRRAGYSASDHSFIKEL